MLLSDTSRRDDAHGDFHRALQIIYPSTTGTAQQVRRLATAR